MTALRSAALRSALPLALASLPPSCGRAGQDRACRGRARRRRRRRSCRASRPPSRCGSRWRTAGTRTGRTRAIRACRRRSHGSCRRASRPAPSSGPRRTRCRPGRSSTTATKARCCISSTITPPRRRAARHDCDARRARRLARLQGDVHSRGRRSHARRCRSRRRREPTPRGARAIAATRDALPRRSPAGGRRARRRRRRSR